MNKDIKFYLILTLFSLPLLSSDGSATHTLSFNLGVWSAFLINWLRVKDAR